MKRFMGLCAIGGLLALHLAVGGATLNYDQEAASIAVDTLSIGEVDTCGPVLVAHCPKVRIMGSWYGDSVLVSVDASIDRVNWTTVYGPTYLGTDATQGNYLHMISQDNVAAGTVIGTATGGGYAYLRLRMAGGDSSVALGVNGRISCVR